MICITLQFYFTKEPEVITHTRTRTCTHSFSPYIIREKKFVLYLAMEKVIRAIDNLLKMLEDLHLLVPYFSLKTLFYFLCMDVVLVRVSVALTKHHD